MKNDISPYITTMIQAIKPFSQIRLPELTENLKSCISLTENPSKVNVKLKHENGIGYEIDISLNTLETDYKTLPAVIKDSYSAQPLTPEVMASAIATYKVIQQTIKMFNLEGKTQAELDRFFGLSHTKTKVANKAYKNNINEPSPSLIHFREALYGIKHYDKWIEDDDDLIFETQSKGVIKYMKLSMFSQETNELIKADIAKDILSKIDWKDRKILRLLSTEAVRQKNNRFILNCRWVLEQIGDAGDVRKKGKKLTAREKLEDLKKRIYRYCYLKVDWELNKEKASKGKKKKIPDGTPIRGTFHLFKIDHSWFEKNGNTENLYIDIEPGTWFTLNREIYKHYTYIPKKLVEIDTYKYPRIYPIGEYICDYFKLNKTKLKNKDKRELTVTVSQIVDVCCTQDEITKAKNNPRTGNWLKNGIIEDMQWLTEELGWQIELIGNFEGKGFVEFETNGAFKVSLDNELEGLILGEKKIETEADTVSKPARKPKFTKDDVRQAIASSRKKVSISAMERYLGQKENWLRRRLDPANDGIKTYELSQADLERILKRIEFLNAPKSSTVPSKSSTVSVEKK